MGKSPSMYYYQNLNNACYNFQVFIGERNESKDHLFFACPYTYPVWTNLADGLLGRFITPDWDANVRSLLHTNYSQMDRILSPMLFQTAIYVVLEREKFKAAWRSMCVS